MEYDGLKGFLLITGTPDTIIHMVGYNLFDCLCSTVEVNDPLVYPHLIAVSGLAWTPPHRGSYDR